MVGEVQGEASTTARPKIAYLSVGAAVVATGAHFTGLYLPVGPELPAPVFFFDKIEHVLGFAVPVLLILWARARWDRHVQVGVSGSFVLAVVTLAAVHAVLSEFIQRVAYRARQGDPIDVLADCVGVALGFGVFAWLNRSAP